MKRLKKQGYAFIIYDADDKKNTKQLDAWKIDAMPVVQIVDDEDDFKVLHQFPPGGYSTRSIDREIQILSKKKKQKESREQKTQEEK